MSNFIKQPQAKKGDFIKHALRQFYALADHYNNLNSNRAEGNAKGFNGRQINNCEQVAQLVKLLCKEVLRGKVNKAGLLKITRTFIGTDIKRSCPTVDAYLAKLKALGIIKMIEVGSHSFDGKRSIQCLYLQINMDIFTPEQAEAQALKICFELKDIITKETSEKNQKNRVSFNFEAHNKEIYINP
jgi:hypothetical protein